MKFDLDEALDIANQAVSQRFRRNLTDVEVIVFKGAWHREEYDQIAAKHQYATSYISQDVAPKLWKVLTESLGEKVKKSNFKEALKRLWEEELKPEEISLNRQQIAPERPTHVTNKLQQSQSNTLNHQTLTPDLYVERPPIESNCYEALLQPGFLIRIKAPSLMGKTFLMNRVLAQMNREGYRTASLSFELADRSTHFTSLNKFLRWFCINLSRELGLSAELDNYWNEELMGSKVSCTTYFERCLLAQTDTPLVLGLDDVDLLFTYPQIYEDFFGLLRTWYEKARSRKLWKKLRLVLVHSTDVYIRLNIDQSPFNVGLPIELSEFTREQVRDLARQHGFEPDTALIEPLMNLVGGHPYLLAQAFSHFKTHPNITPEQFSSEATTDAGIYGNHLRKFWLNLQERPKLALAFKRVVSSPKPLQLEPMSAYQLHSMGLVNFSGNQVETRCYLYRQYFSEHFGDS